MASWKTIAAYSGGILALILIALIFYFWPEISQSFAPPEQKPAAIVPPKPAAPVPPPEPCRIPQNKISLGVPVCELQDQVSNIQTGYGPVYRRMAIKIPVRVTAAGDYDLIISFVSENGCHGFLQKMIELNQGDNTAEAELGYSSMPDNAYWVRGASGFVKISVINRGWDRRKAGCGLSDEIDYTHRAIGTYSMLGIGTIQTSLDP